MRYAALEIGSSRSVILVMVLAPAIVLYTAWHAFLGLDLGDLGGAEFMKTAQKNEVGEVVSSFEKVLEPFLSEVLRAQIKAFENGIKTFLVGSFLTLSTLTSMTFCRAITEGSIINEIGLLRERRRVFFERVIPLFIYAGFMSTLLSAGAMIFLPFTGVEVTKRLLGALLITTFLASLWGIFLSAIVGSLLRDNVYSLLSAFFVVGIFLFAGNYGELLFPFAGAFEFLLSGGQSMELVVIFGLSIFAVSPLAALKAFERGDYY
ncbi:hypothetical protein [Thermococcus waiotapuensis]|uniref:Uncharacterized protein n=1 Tax=Thermococcus waiotapuensis TaxID=90909 RepID=A0AAE4T3X0_9EURY|nr:hypothetical protein [Thermococcus waiotapuensis]MDV3104243.1 hypothetical protein [Thermococcus waiotapuensis]